MRLNKGQKWYQSICLHLVLNRWFLFSNLKGTCSLNWKDWLQRSKTIKCGLFISNGLLVQRAESGEQNSFPSMGWKTVPWFKLEIGFPLLEIGIGKPLLVRLNCARRLIPAFDTIMATIFLLLADKDGPQILASAATMCDLKSKFS